MPGLGREAHMGPGMTLQAVRWVSDRPMDNLDRRNRHIPRREYEINRTAVEKWRE